MLESWLSTTSNAGLYVLSCNYHALNRESVQLFSPRVSRVDPAYVSAMQLSSRGWFKNSETAKSKFAFFLDSTVDPIPTDTSSCLASE